jgi:hypothetical protein
MCLSVRKEWTEGYAKNQRDKKTPRLSILRDVASSFAILGLSEKSDFVGSMFQSGVCRQHLQHLAQLWSVVCFAYRAACHRQVRSALLLRQLLAQE